jgi:hypothetical protein
LASSRESKELMSDRPSQDPLKPAKIDIRTEIAHSGWKDDPVVGFEHKASLAIARWVLMIFGGVYALGFIAMFFLFFRTDATFEKGSELIKFMVQSLLPLVTLAVGYYLGDRTRQTTTTPRSRK